MKKEFIYILLALLILTCKREGLEKANTTKLFASINSSDSNIQFINTVKQSDTFNCIRYTYALTGAGVAVGDVNNDGLEDVYFAANQTSNKLYLNKGDFEFEDITKAANVKDDSGWTTGVSMIDINNDGWLDIYVCKSASLNNNTLRENKLFINQKNGTFKDEANKWGIDHNGFSIQSYFFDYDKDGDLDLYLVNHRPDFENTLRIEKKENQKFFPETSDQLFKNEGGFFVNVTQQAKLINKAWGLSASIGDFNNDGWPDIYVANDYIQPDFLYINNRDGTFSNQINKRFKHISFNSMGSDYADINNDLLPDLMVLEMSSEDHERSKENMATMNTEGFNKIVKAKYNKPYMSNVFQLNNANGSFSDIAQLAGLSKTDWSWAPLIADFDNDGHKDIFITNGIERNFANQDYAKKVKQNLDNNITMTISEVIEMMPSEKIENYSFKNNGDLTFSKTTKAWGFSQKINSNGVAYADFDNDGDLDLVINNMSDKAALYKNNSTSNFIKLKLEGSSTNKGAIGAKVKIFTNSNQQYQELYSTRGYLSSVTKVLNFGLANHDNINKIEVVWDNGLVTILENIKANQTLRLNINSAKNINPLKFTPNQKLLPVNPMALGINYKHKESVFDDFKKQVLLPQKMSQQGPALAVADINNDGLDDFFVGGAKGQPASLYLQNKTGSFSNQNLNIFNKDKNYEDTSALFFDANGDGFLDLYVTSGSYELDENSPFLQDRLYYNNQKGGFIKSKRLPKMRTNTKTVKAIDFDNDGDLDIAIGGHVVPGKYPLASKSYLLKNEKGKFTDVTNKTAKEFASIGIVNDFIFSDYDGDGDKDLIIVGDWMPITLFENENGNFVKTDKQAFNKTEGWWNTVNEVDLDNDGDLDYIFGNLGNNNKFQPTLQKPLHIYGNNFDNNSTYDLVLSKDYKGKLVPIRGKECSTQQNAFVSEKVKTYKDFAKSSLIDIYGGDKIKASYHKQVFTFSSAYAINNGNGSFEFKTLPNTAQFGPTKSVQLVDVNNDGYTDVIGAGAIYETEVETIPYDSNNGYILLSDKKGELTPYKDYNFYVGKNAKTMKTIIISGNKHLLIGNNDDSLSIFKL